MVDSKRIRLQMFTRKLRALSSRLATLGGLLLGDISYQPPQWLKLSAGRVKERSRLLSDKTSAYVRIHPKRFYGGSAALIVVIASTVLGYQWYGHRPKPAYVSLSVEAPGLTPLKDDAKPDPLKITFGASASELGDEQRVVKKGIKLLPAIPGEWRWESDRELTFKPAQDWPIDQKYDIDFDKKLFPREVLLEDYHLSFRTKPFTTTLEKAEFYQNPVNPREKRVVTVLKFSHPVDPESLKKRISLKLEGQKDGILSFGKESTHYDLTFGKLNGEAFIHSDQVSIPKRDTFMKVEIEAGVHSSRGGNSTPKALSAQVAIPGIYNFFKISSASIHLVPNEKYESDQVLTVEATTPVEESELKKNFTVFLLPPDRPAEKGAELKKNYHWKSATELTPKVLAQASPLKFELIPNEHDPFSLYNFKFEAPVGRSVYVKVNKDTKSFGEYFLSHPFEEVLKVPAFPPEVRIMHDGAILSLSGERKLSVLSRGIQAIRFETGRIIASEVNHMITQTSGSFQKPFFENYRFSEENISERFNEVQELGDDGKGRNKYTAFDFGKYLTLGSAANRKGLFFLKAQAWDTKNKKPIGYPSYEDTRFILLTDLGVIVKSASDQQKEVFVQSISSGLPVNGAHVEVIGKNGIAVVSATTNAEGRVSFPSLAKLDHEKTPTAFIVRKENDLSFMSYTAYDRNLNFSRFDVGGSSSAGDAQKLSAYLFSERGIYRPGDEFNIGIIVRSQTWSQSLEGVPLEAQVRDARGLQIYKEKIQLDKSGFSQIKYKTDETSPTGHYEISLYLVEDEKHLHLLGSNSIRVEEFLPDTMKIFSHLFNGGMASERLEGWVSPEKLEGLVSLKNLFGTPAEAHRVTASIRLSPSLPAFKKYKDYHFSDPLRAKKNFTEELQETKTNDQGEARFDLDLSKFEKATYRINFMSQGYALEGGRSVTAESSVLVSPLPYLLGFKSNANLGYIKKQSQASVDIIAVDPELNRTKVSDLTAQLIENRTVSVLTRQYDGTFKYESVKKEIPISKTPLTVLKTGFKYIVPSEQPGDFFLSVRDSSALELLKVEFSVVGQTNLKQKLERNSELQIKLAKADYAPGEEIELQITAPYLGAGLITIEREKVYASKWFKASTTNSVQKIRVPNDLEGGGYVNVSFVRSLDSKEIFTSPLSYGVVPFSVSRERRTNPVTLESSELVKPGEPLKIKYSTKRPGKIVVFAVDEGILQVAGYKTPEPLGFFFRKRALEISTQQLMDLILPEFSVVKSVAASGGDQGNNALGKNLNPFKRKREKPVVYWSGIIDSGPEVQELTYLVPDYFNGSLRLMAVAVAPESIGVSEKRVVVRGDFVITPTVPTFATPGDEFEVGISLANNVEGSGGDQEITLSAETSTHLKLLSEKVLRFKIAEGHESSGVFKFKVNDQLGSANLTFQAVLGAHKGRSSTDLSIRPQVPFRTELTTGTLDSGAKEVDMTRKIYNEYGEKSATVSTVPLGVSHGLLKYLTAYPFGCTEQLVSKTFPILVLKGKPEFGIVPEKVDENLKEMIRILRTRQNADGAFGMWAPDSNAPEFYAAYAYHFMIEAREKGVAIPQELVTRTESHLKSLLQKDPQSLAEARVAAYALYLLARTGTIASNELVGLRKVLQTRYAKEWIQDLTGIYIAATYQLYQLQDEALSLISQSTLSKIQVTDYANYYDSLVRNSQYLYIIAKHFPKKLENIGANELKILLEPILQGDYNTISSSYAILALDAYATQVGTPDQVQGLSISQLLTQSNWQLLNLPAGYAPKIPVSLEASKVKIENTTSKHVFYQTAVSGFDQKIPDRVLKNKLEVYREIRDEKGAVVEKATLGAEYEVHIKIRALAMEEGRAGLPNVAIIDLLPSGFEVVQAHSGVPKEQQSTDEIESNRPSQVDSPGHDGGGEGDPEPGSINMDSNTEEGSGGDASIFDLFKIGSAYADSNLNSKNRFNADYIDIREDRVLVFGTVTSGLSEFVYRIKAIARGVFTVPPIYAESMYDRTIQARGLGGKITVEGK